MKKAGKILGITFLCVIAFIAVSAGIIIYKGMHPAKSPASNQTTETSFDEAESEYIDVPTYNEFQLYAVKASEQPISLSEDVYMSIMGLLKEQSSDFRMEEYYALDRALDMYHSTSVNKSRENTLLTNGMLDTDKLIQAVNRNNGAVMQNGRNTLNAFYTELDNSDIAMICGEISKVVNDKSDEFDIRQIANTLENLTLFKRTGTTSNAYVSTKLAFIYNPIMTDNYDIIQRMKGGSEEKTWEMVIDHEIMHLMQYGASDNNDENGIEVGFCRMYNVPDSEKNIPVDSLYFLWILEAGAELGMSDYLGVEPGTYEKKISYVTSYNLSRFYENSLPENGLERVVFQHTMEEAFEALGLETENEKQEFLKFMYSVEVTQSDTEDLWEYYKSKTGKILTEEEKLGIRMDIRTDAVKYLTKNFFVNLCDAIHEGAVTDLDTAFYLMRLWELDTFNHLNYTQESSLEHAKDFIIWYDQMQSRILTAIAESSNLDPAQMQTLYAEYCLQLEDKKGETRENCNLLGMNKHMQNYILSAGRSRNSSHFSRISDVAKWIEL